MSLFALVAALTVAANDPPAVGIGWPGPADERPCRAAVKEWIGKELTSGGYDVVEIDGDGVWIDIQQGRVREADSRPDGDEPPPRATYVTAYFRGQASRAIADTDLCGVSLQRQLTRHVVSLVDDAARIQRGETPDGTWIESKLPYTFYATWHTRFRGEAQPVELGVFGVLPGSSFLPIGVSARTNMALFGMWLALGPDIAFWHGHDTTVWQPGLTAGFHSGTKIGNSLAWSWGLELGALLDIYNTPEDDGVKFGLRLGAPFKFGVAYNKAVLTVMPYVRSGTLDLKVDGVTAYRSENWGVLARISWGMGGRH